MCLLLRGCQTVCTVNTRSPWRRSEWLTKQGKQEGIPFQNSDGRSVTWIPINLFPGTPAVGFPHLAQSHQLVGGKAPLTPPPSSSETCGGSNYRTTQASAQEKNKHKNGAPWLCAPPPLLRPNARCSPG